MATGGFSCCAPRSGWAVSGPSRSGLVGPAPHGSPLWPSWDLFFFPDLSEVHPRPGTGFDALTQAAGKATPRQGVCPPFFAAKETNPTQIVCVCVCACACPPTRAEADGPVHILSSPEQQPQGPETCGEAVPLARTDKGLLITPPPCPVAAAGGCSIL